MTETPKQRMRRLLDRLKKLPDELRREADRFIEQMDDQEAEDFIMALDEAEKESPGTIDAFIDNLNENGIPEDLDFSDFPGGF